MELSTKLKIFSQFFVHLWDLHQILNILKKKMSLRADVFRKFIECKKRGYLNDEKAPRENTYGQSRCWRV